MAFLNTQTTAQTSIPQRRRRLRSPSIKAKAATKCNLAAVAALLVGVCVTNLGWLLFLQPDGLGNGGVAGGLMHPLEDFTYSSSCLGNTIRQQRISTFPSTTPIVIISSLRPDYLKQVMESIHPPNQHPNTPIWILHSKRYLFVHKHDRNDKKNAYQDVTALASQYNYTVHTFDGLYNSKLAMNINANLHWYRMMQFLFDELQVQEAFIVEDDAVLAPDGLLVAAKLLQEKRRRLVENAPDKIHSICLGGWSGENTILPDPRTFLAVRSRYFQAMAYSMDRNVFHQILERKKQRLLQVPADLGIADWSEEITDANLIEDLNSLTPSVGRMFHVGKYGMGLAGTGDSNSATRDIAKRPNWHHWQNELTNPNTTLDDLYLEPKELADRFGFVCYPPVPMCSVYHYNQWRQKGVFNSQNNDIPRYPQSKYSIPPNTTLGPIIPLIGASSYPRLAQAPSSYAIDKNLTTSWYSPVLSWSKRHPPWIEVKLQETVDISSVTILWDRVYASRYEILLDDTSVLNIADGQGMTEFVNFENLKKREKALNTMISRVKIICHRSADALWRERLAIREIIVRG